MKTFLSFCLIAVSFVASVSFVYADSGSTAPSGDCNYDPSEIISIPDALQRCKPRWVIEASNEDYSLNGGARQRIVDVANQIILVGSLLSVWAIVYAGILYTIAAGNDERVKTAKTSLKFGIIGFIVMLLSFPLVNAVVQLFYSTSG